MEFTNVPLQRIIENEQRQRGCPDPLNDLYFLLFYNQCPIYNVFYDCQYDGWQ